MHWPTASTSNRDSRAACSGKSVGGEYRDAEDLYALVRAIDWPKFAVERTLRVNVAATRIAADQPRVCDAEDQGRHRGPLSRGLRLTPVGGQARTRRARPRVPRRATSCTLYLDTSGEPLFKRGYRRATPRTRRCARTWRPDFVVLSGWTGTALLDPMCGSGTIAIEAALIAANRAPGLARTFGFQKLAWYDGPTWQRIRQRALDRVAADPRYRRSSPSDNAPPAIAKAPITRRRRSVALDPHRRRRRADANRTGAIRRADFESALRRQARRRAELAAFYPKLGDALKQRFAGWMAWLFTGDLRLAKLIGLKVARRIPLYNGRSNAGCSASRWCRAATAAPALGDKISSPLPMLPARHYESEHTKFMRELMDSVARANRRAARGSRDLVEQGSARVDRERAKSRVPMQPYVYPNDVGTETR